MNEKTNKGFKLLSQTVQVIGLILDFIGALLFAIPLIKSKKTIEEESSTYIGYNPPLRKSMKRDRWLAIIGLSLLLLGFALQIIAVFIKP